MHLSAFDTPEGSSLHPYLTTDGSTLYFMRQFGEDRSTRGIWMSYMSEADTYYVDIENGSDLNNGLSYESAFASIQVGINAAEDGDTILVYPGIYSEKVNFMGKDVTVQGVAGPVGVPVLENIDDFAVLFNNDEGSSPTIENVTIVNNLYGMMAFTGSEPMISNSIFYNNTYGDMLQCQASFSCYHGASRGHGNIDADPLFADIDSGDFHLCSQSGRYIPEQDLWILDDLTSPCIDRGDTNTDYSCEPNPNGGRINMGAYGGTDYASKSKEQ